MFQAKVPGAQGKKACLRRWPERVKVFPTMVKSVLAPITDNDRLKAVCAELAATDFLTIDTEFNRKDTYYSQLCVIQVADDDAAYAIDALAPGIDLAPLYALLANQKLLKVFHAARQDLEIFYHAMGKLPTPVFDTQIAAMVCGFGEQVGYETLVKRLTNGKLDKAIRFTDWSRRPLSEKQVRYALGDVIYLREVYRKLSAQLDRTKRTAWLEEELAVISDPLTYDADIYEHWRRMKTRSSNRRFLAVVRELAAWREMQARERDIPRNRVLRDEVLLEIAAHPPTDLEELRRIRALPKRYKSDEQAEGLLEPLEKAAGLPDKMLPEAPPRRREHEQAGPDLDLLKVLLKYRCREAEVAPKLICNSEDLERFALGKRKDIPFLKGWRRDVFGEDALSLVEGRYALATEHGHLHLIPLDGQV